MPHKSAGFDVENASAIHNRMFAAIVVQRAQESHIAGTKHTPDEKNVMKSESIVEQSSQDTRNEIATVLADLVFPTRDEITEILESRMTKIHHKIKAEVVETVVDTFEDAIQPKNPIPMRDRSRRCTISSNTP